jgi:hypothetical protein
MTERPIGEDQTPANQMGTSSSTQGSGGISLFDPVINPIMRRKKLKDMVAKAILKASSRHTEQDKTDERRHQEETALRLQEQEREYEAARGRNKEVAKTIKAVKQRVQWDPQLPESRVAQAMREADELVAEIKGTEQRTYKLGELMSSERSYRSTVCGHCFCVGFCLQEMTQWERKPRRRTLGEVTVYIPENQRLH